MKQQEDFLVYDDDDAVKFILNYLHNNGQENIDSIKVEYVMDVVYEYYDENGLIDEDSTEEASIDEEEMFNFILKASKKDKMQLNEDEILLILEGEYEYGKSIGVYSEEEE